MGLKRVLSGSWFIRLVMISWIICAVAIYVLFKNMELIVHGQLYYYGLISSPDWADPYRIYTWLIYISLIVPTTLSGIALVSSFFKVEKLQQDHHKETSKWSLDQPLQRLFKEMKLAILTEFLALNAKKSFAKR